MTYEERRAEWKRIHYGKLAACRSKPVAMRLFVRAENPGEGMRLLAEHVARASDWQADEVCTDQSGLVIGYWFVCPPSR